MTETDIRTKFILNALTQSGWDIQTQMAEEHYFTDGRIHVQGKSAKHGEGNIADYILSYKANLPLALIEAKSNKFSIEKGLPDLAEVTNIEYFGDPSISTHSNRA